MKVLIYGINFSPELTGIGKYSGEMAEWMADRGHQVRVITAPPYYPQWKIKDGYTNSFSFSDRKNTSIIRCPLYIPSKPSTFWRLLHLFSFSLSSFFPILGCWRWRPNLVILIVPTMFCAVQAIILAKLAGARSVIHVQDYEVDAMFDLTFVKGHYLKKIALRFESLILGGFHFVSTISSGMLERAYRKGVDKTKLVFFPNWADPSFFETQADKASTSNDLGLDINKRIVLYSGNIGEKQGLDGLVLAAAELQQRTDIVFVVVGEGSFKNRLVQMSIDLKLTNIKFFSLLPPSDFQSLLACADCHLVLQKKGAADAVLPSKLTNILAVGGNAVVTAEQNTTLGVLCREFPGLAVLVRPEEVDQLVSGIEQALLRSHPNPVAQKYARDHLDRDVILERFLSAVGV